MRKQNLEFSLEKCVRPAAGGAGGGGDANATVVSWKGVQQAGEAAGFLLVGWTADGQSSVLIGRANEAPPCLRQCQRPGLGSSEGKM